MKDHLKGIGAQLRQTFEGVVGRPMSWQLIDALCKLDEAEVSREQAQSTGAARPVVEPGNQPASAQNFSAARDEVSFSDGHDDSGAGSMGDEAAAGVRFNREGR